MVVVEMQKIPEDAKSVCIKHRQGTMPAGAMSAGEVLRDELVAAACLFCCLLLLLLLQLLLLLHEGTHALQMVHPSVSPARGNVGSSGQKVCLVYATLGASLANGKRPESCRPTECSGRISYHPHMALP